MAKKKRDRLDELVDELLKNQSPEDKRLAKPFK